MKGEELAADVRRHLREHGIGPGAVPDELVSEVCGELVALDEMAYREPQARLWVDVEYRADHGHARALYTYGPFVRVESAEDCVIGLAARPDVLRAHIRDPEGGRL